MRPPTITPTVRVLLNVLASALVLRFVRIGDRPLWVDEAVTWAQSTRGTWTDTLFAEPNHPPVWRLVTRFWISFAGDSETALRAPAALCSLVAVFLSFLLARRLFDPARAPRLAGIGGLDEKAPLWIAAFVAASGFGIEYAQEARPYAALLAESLGLSLLYLRWLDAPRRGVLLGYALLGALALHTHYFAAWVLLAHAVHALLVARIRRDVADRPRAVPFLGAQAAAALLFAPWAVHAARNFEAIHPGAPYEPFGRLAHSIWRMTVGPAIAALDRPRVDAGWRAALAESWPLVAASAVLFLAPFALGVRALARDRGARLFLAASVLVPVAATLAVFPMAPLVHEKYLVFLGPPLVAVAVLGARAARAPWNAFLLAGLVVLHATGVVAIVASDSRPVARALSGGHAYGKEDWARARFYVASRAEEGDLVLVHGTIAEPAWSYYDRGRTSTVHLPAEPLSTAGLVRAIPSLGEPKAVFLVLSHEDTADRDHYVGVVHEALASKWGEVSVSLPEFPLRFDAQWGIRVFRYARP